MKYAPWIILVVVVLNNLPSNKDLRKSDDERKMMQLTINKMENELGVYRLRTMDLDSKLTKCRAGL